MERMAQETLKARLDDPEVFLLDVRSPRAWEESGAMIKGAHRFDPGQPTEAWAPELPRDKQLVAY